MPVRRDSQVQAERRKISNLYQKEIGPQLREYNNSKATLEVRWRTRSKRQQIASECVKKFGTI